MGVPPRYRAVRAARAGLSRRQILDAAEAIAQRQGIEAVTIRRIAEWLQITPMALYRHIIDKDDLLRALLDRSLAVPQPPPLPADPRDRVLALVRWQHARLAHRPWAVPIAAAGDLYTPASAWSLDQVHRALRESGLGSREASCAVRIIWRFLVGDLRQPGLWRGRPAPGRSRTIRRVGLVVPPAVAALTERWLTSRRERFDEDLVWLVDALLP